MFMINYFLKFLLENALRIYTFSLVNMMAVRKESLKC